MIHLDTHVVVWIYTDNRERLSATARRLIERDVSGISPMVVLELGFLHEIGRIGDEPEAVLSGVREGLELQVSTASFATVASEAVPIDWTRDPFDRMIVATARVDRVRLLTRDRTIREHAPEAVWD